ncbi:hypothetical protein HMPREF9622_00698 [Cutibacterium modestum HL037PA3]|uniref:Uncharacterized protein n=1 Tax=Cutibacterium modestum HL044PA1 TaxID=765109 RepID=A0ABN0C447_9ACTN|nr:hypothetical protein HMPREF9621_01274 [Cutibacterium modestum HL037PA2]EFS91980.1 hypothetical protein HMPREF9607_01846 [Cutibacterium modestum HL044PA1]EFT16244.1 hypothetical protein HMPREF9622_00698 [Cutibacterium modestum HL037PA3]EGG27749.1 hypothetical protein PA08_0436 [Cutibacterium modestum P08]
MKPVIRVLNNDVLARVVDGAGYMVCSPADNDLGVILKGFIGVIAPSSRMSLSVMRIMR